MNDYGSLMDAGFAAPEPAAPSAYGSLMDDDLAKGKQAMAGALTGAVHTNPDEFSAKRRVAGYLGYPVAAVEAQPALVDQAKVQQVQQDTAAAPVLARRYSDADFAKLAHDDSGILSKLETSIAKAARYVMGADTDGGVAGDLRYGGNALIAGTSGIFRGVFDLAAMPFNAAGLDNVRAIGGNPLQRIADGFGIKARTAQASMDAIPLASDVGTIRQGIRSGLSSAVGNLAFTPLALLGPAGVAAALTGMVGVPGGQSCLQSRQ